LPNERLVLDAKGTFDAAHSDACLDDNRDVRIIDATIPGHLRQHPVPNSGAPSIHMRERSRAHAKAETIRLRPNTWLAKAAGRNACVSFFARAQGLRVAQTDKLSCSQSKLWGSDQRIAS